MQKSTNIDSAAAISEYPETAVESLSIASRTSANVSRKFLDDPDYILRAWAVILTLASIDWLWAWHAGFEISGLMPVVKGVAMFAAFGFLIDYSRRAPRVAEAAHYCALWIGFFVALEILSYAVATLRMPLWDSQFARADAALGFNWNAGFDWITALSPMAQIHTGTRLSQHDHPGVAVDCLFRGDQTQGPKSGAAVDWNSIGINYHHAVGTLSGSRSIRQRRDAAVVGGAADVTRW